MSRVRVELSFNSKQKIVLDTIIIRPLLIISGEKLPSDNSVKRQMSHLVKLVLDRANKSQPPEMILPRSNQTGERILYPLQEGGKRKKPLIL